MQGNIRKIATLGTAFGMLALAGCYHATVETGRTPNGVVVEKAWAHSFIGGLVPPSTVETASRCPNGVARVQTQLSFLNMLANALTAGIYSPMSIRVECAGPTAFDAKAEVLTVAQGGSAAEALNQAVSRARESGEAVFVQFAD